MQSNYHTNDLKSNDLKNNLKKKYNKLSKKGDKREINERKGSN